MPTLPLILATAATVHLERDGQRLTDPKRKAADLSQGGVRELQTALELRLKACDMHEWMRSLLCDVGKERRNQVHVY